MTTDVYAEHVEYRRGSRRFGGRPETMRAIVDSVLSTVIFFGSDVVLRWILTAAMRKVL
jgi:hypothetical protein